jgi:diguanylate cyclase (GGDEF)-like protein
MRILLVEDTRAMAAVMAARLASFGYEVSIAENGRVAVDRFSEIAPDLVLMDIEMPVMNGFEATNRIRALEATQQWAWTPILFLTASDTAENLVTAIEAGGDDFLAKAVPEVVLQSKMKAMSRIAALRQRLSVANQKLAEQANRDGLTGLCNRRHMDARLDVAWCEAVRQSGAFALLMIDVDNFKNYNDHYGHQAGDDCLRMIAATVAAVVETSNAEHRTDGAFAARYGGEEFAVIVPGASPQAYEFVASTILAAIRACGIAHERNAQWGIATASIGGARLEPAAGKVIDLFRAADGRLYRAKTEGRNRAELRD